MRRIAMLLALIPVFTMATSGGLKGQEPSKTIEVHAKRFDFTPSEITLKKGETVTIKLFSDDVTHSLSVKDLDINREVSKGHPEDIVVTPQTAGDFHGQCGRFCGVGHGKMLFTVHVTD